MKTKERLAQALHAAGLFDMERKAREGLYDDFESPIATPCIQLVLDLNAAARLQTDDARRKLCLTLASRARRGDFDGTREEAEAWMAREGGQFLRGGGH